jgi:hypothetical protein
MEDKWLRGHHKRLIARSKRALLDQWNNLRRTLDKAKHDLSADEYEELLVEIRKVVKQDQEKYRQWWAERKLPLNIFESLMREEKQRFPELKE